MTQSTDSSLPASSQSVDEEKRITGWLLVVSASVIVIGMAYGLWWPTVVRHHDFYWVYPGDIWGTVRAAHWIGWGGFSFIYSSRTGLVTLPGFHALLTPIVMLTSKLGLSETAPGLVPVPKPSAWLIVGPFTMAFAALPIFGMDIAARRLSLSSGKRRLLAVGVACLVWPTVAIWGHPEDVAALGLLALTFAFLLGRQYTAAGWLLGAALAMQLYVVMAIPLFVAYIGWRRAVPLLARAAIAPGFLFVAVVVPNPHASLHALLQQPNYPHVDYPTPWVALAPSLGHGAVAAGPGRILGLFLALGIGLLAVRFRGQPLMVLWLCGIILSIRCLTESVMDPYYVMPAVVFGLGAAAFRGRTRFLLAMGASLGVTVSTYYHPGEWPYWLEMVTLFAFIFAVTMPRSTGLVTHSLAEPVGRIADPDVLPAANAMAVSAISPS